MKNERALSLPDVNVTVWTSNRFFCYIRGRLDGRKTSEDNIIDITDKYGFFVHQQAKLNKTISVLYRKAVDAAAPYWVKISDLSRNVKDSEENMDERQKKANAGDSYSLSHLMKEMDAFEGRITAKTDQIEARFNLCVASYMKGFISAGGSVKKIPSIKAYDVCMKNYHNSKETVIGRKEEKDVRHWKQNSDQI